MNLKINELHAGAKIMDAAAKTGQDSASNGKKKVDFAIEKIHLPRLHRRKTPQNQNPGIRPIKRPEAVRQLHSL